MSDIIWPWAYGGSSIDRENTLRAEASPALPALAKWWGNQARVSRGEPVRMIDFLELDRLQYWARCQQYQVMRGRTPSGLYFDPQVIDDYADTFGKGYFYPEGAPSGIMTHALHPVWSMSMTRVLHDYDKDADEIEVKWDLPWSANIPYESYYAEASPVSTPFVHSFMADRWAFVAAMPWGSRVFGLTQRGEVIQVIGRTAHYEPNITVTESTGVVPTWTATLKIRRAAALGAEAGDILKDEVVNFMSFDPSMRPVNYNVGWKGWYRYTYSEKPVVLWRIEPIDNYYGGGDFAVYGDLYTFGTYQTPYSGKDGQPIVMSGPAFYLAYFDTTDKSVIDAGLYLCGREMIPVDPYNQYSPLPIPDEAWIGNFAYKTDNGRLALPEGSTAVFSGVYPPSLYAPPRKCGLQREWQNTEDFHIFSKGFPYAEKLNLLRALCELLSEACKTTGHDHYTWVPQPDPNQPEYPGHWTPEIRQPIYDPKEWSTVSVPLPSFSSIYQPEAVGGRRFNKG